MKTFSCDQYSPTWWELRRGVPTASDFDKIITPAKGEFSKSAQEYANELVGDKYFPGYGQKEDYVSAAMKNGSLMEPTVRRFYEFERNIDVQEIGFCLTDDGRFGCSPDGLIGDDGGLELKHPLPKTQVAYLLDGGLPDKYKPQVHGCLVVTGRAYWDFLSYSPGLPPLLVRIEPNAYTQAVRDCLEAFWPIYQRTAKRIAEWDTVGRVTTEAYF